MKILKEIKSIYEAIRDEGKREIDKYKGYDENLQKAVEKLTKLKKNTTN